MSPSFTAQASVGSLLANGKLLLAGVSQAGIISVGLLSALTTYSNSIFLLAHKKKKEIFS
jgi:hypothetical protein